MSMLVALPLTVLAIVETSAAPPCTPQQPCRSTLGSPAYWVDAPAVFVAISLVVLAFVVPRVAVWAAVVVAVAFAIPGGALTSFPEWWSGLAVLWGVLGGLEVAGRIRQRLVVSTWTTSDEPSPVPDRRLRWDEDTRRLAWAVTAVLLAAAAVLLVLHERALQDVERFEGSALAATAKVVDPGVEGPLVLDVTRRRYEVGAPLESDTVGTEPPVLVDPPSGRAELVAEPTDPSWLVGWAAVAVLLAAGAWTTLWSRGRRRADC